MRKECVKIIREFQTLDENADLKLTRDEAPDLFVTDSVDSDANSEISLQEWGEYKDNPEWSPVEDLLQSDLFSKGMQRFADIGISDRYEALVGLVKWDPLNEIELDNYLEMRAPTISVLTSLGFTQSDAVETSQAIYRKVADETIRSVNEALTGFGLKSQSSRNAIIKKVITEGRIPLTEIPKLNNVLDLLSFSEAKKKDFLAYSISEGYTWEWLDTIIDDDSRSKMLSVVSKDDLKAMLSKSTKGDDYNVFEILAPAIGGSIDALRSYGAKDSAIKAILFERIPEVKNGQKLILESIPGVLKAFAKLDQKSLCAGDSLQELHMWFNSIDKEKNVFASFATLPGEIDWLIKTFEDPNEIKTIISHAFLTPFSFRSFHTLFDKFQSLGMENLTSKDLIRSLRISESTFWSPLLTSLKTVDSLKIKKEHKKELAELFLRNPDTNFSGMDIKDLRDAKFSDINIFRLIKNTLTTRTDTFNILQAIKVLKKIGIGRDDSADMMPYLLKVMEHGNTGTLLFDINQQNSALDELNLGLDDISGIEKTFPLGESGPSEFWDFIFFLGNVRGDDRKSMSLADCRELCLSAKEKLGITRYGRYTPTILNAALSGERREKHAFIPIASDDHNGAFYSTKYDLELLLTEGYSIDIVESDHEDNIYQALEKYPDGSIDLLFINGHGKPTSVMLSRDSSLEENSIDIADEEWKGYLSKMRRGGKVIFAACSTGKGDESIVHKFREWAKDLKIEFIAPPNDVSAKLTVKPDIGIEIEYRNEHEVIQGTLLKSGEQAT